MTETSAADNAEVWGASLGPSSGISKKKSLGFECGSSEEIKVISKYAQNHHQTHI